MKPAANNATQVILQLGLGFGGLEGLAEATRLLEAMPTDEERAKWRIIVIERNTEWTAGAMNQYVFTGRKTAAACYRSYSDCRYHNIAEIEIVHDTIIGIDLSAKSVTCANSGTYLYNHLIIGLGIEAQQTPLVKDKVFNLCDMKSMQECASRIQSIQSGTVIITVTRLPYKCPVAPFEFAFLVNDMLKLRGVREHVRVVLTFPKHAAVPVKCPQLITELLKKSNIEFIPGVQPKSIERNEQNQLLITLMPHPKFNPEGKVCPVPEEPLVADIILGMLPFRAPEVLQPYCNDKGLLPTDTNTLRVQKFPNVYCFGDCAAMMVDAGEKQVSHPKAGGFSEGQARIAWRNILSGVSFDESAPHRQDSSCIATCALETSLNSLALVSIDLHSEEKKPKFAIEMCDDIEYKTKWLEERFKKHFK